MFPLTCYHCAEDLPDSSDGPLCGLCDAMSGTRDGLRCRRCDVPLKYGGAHCWACKNRDKPPALRGLRSAADFGPEIRSVIHAFKYQSRQHLAAPLANRLIAAFERYPEASGANALVPVPLNSRRQRQRGFNQAEELARRLSAHSRIPIRNILVRSKRTLRQAGLKKEDRLKNVRHAFEAERGAGMGGTTVLLIDDVATTGATLEACAAALKRIGVRKVYALVVARQAHAAA